MILSGVQLDLPSSRREVCREVRISSLITYSMACASRQKGHIRCTCGKAINVTTEDFLFRSVQFVLATDIHCDYQQMYGTNISIIRMLGYR